MATIKSFTSLEQSKKLADILPLKSADGHWFNGYLGVNYRQEAKDFYDTTNNEYIPAWSLAALLDVLSLPDLIQDKVDGELFWQCSVYDEDGNSLCETYDNNPVDAAFEMILKLHELNLY